MFTEDLEVSGIDKDSSKSCIFNWPDRPPETLPPQYPPIDPPACYPYCSFDDWPPILPPEPPDDDPPMPPGTIDHGINVDIVTHLSRSLASFNPGHINTETFELSNFTDTSAIESLTNNDEEVSSVVFFTTGYISDSNMVGRLAQSSVAYLGTRLVTKGTDFFKGHALTRIPGPFSLLFEINYQYYNPIPGSDPNIKTTFQLKDSLGAEIDTYTINTFATQINRLIDAKFFVKRTGQFFSYITLNGIQVLPD